MGLYIGFCRIIGFRVHVGIWYILRAQRGSHILTLRPKCIPYTYMDPLGMIVQGSGRFRGLGFRVQDVGIIGFRDEGLGMRV